MCDRSIDLYVLRSLGRAWCRPLVACEAQQDEAQCNTAVEKRSSSVFVLVHQMAIPCKCQHCHGQIMEVIITRKKKPTSICQTVHLFNCFLFLRPLYHVSRKYYLRFKKFIVIYTVIRRTYLLAKNNKNRWRIESENKRFS